jgi:hypothetical protein
MEVPKSVSWSYHLEGYFKKIGEQSQAYNYLHKRSEALYSFRSTIIDLPVIVLSTIAGTLSIGSSQLFGEGNERGAAVGIGCLSLVVGVLNTIGTYFSWSKRAEAHRISSIEYAKLYRFIQIELGLPRHERMSPSDLLKLVRETYERLTEISPLIPPPVINEFKKKVKDYNGRVATPTEANGLSEIKIYEDERVGAEEKVEPPSPPIQIPMSRTNRPSALALTEV